ncbi:hypothetical protein QBC39DRAFT_373238 [Podospora conica]|nr:hypothetical protein QBC39DRAFT_373238 [Schizothecium conicum]
MPLFPSSPRATTLLLALLASAATASALPPSRIFARQDTCLQGFDKCPNSPANFCCPTGRTCLSLAAGTTLLCCPTGESCAKIEAISCDISRQDASRDQNSRIKTTALTSVLPKCGTDLCCPFGYSCAGDNRCVMDKDQSIPPPPPPPSSSSSTTTTTPPTSTPSAPASSTPTPPPPPPTLDTTNGAAASPEPTASPSPNNTPSAAIIAGITIGAFVAVLAAVLVAFLLIRRNNRSPHRPHSKKPNTTSTLKRTPSSTSSFGNIISGPLPPADGTPLMRSDFSRRDIVPAPLYNATRNLTPPDALLRNSSVAYGGAAPPPAYASPKHPPPPQTPPRQVRGGMGEREPSSVEIDVFADPMALTPETGAGARGPGGHHRRRGSGMTTFTQLMDEADLGGVARGQERFVPYRPGTAGESPARRV